MPNPIKAQTQPAIATLLVADPEKNPYRFDRNSITGLRPACFDQLLLIKARLSMAFVVFLALRMNSRAKRLFFFMLADRTMERARPNLR